MSDLIKYFDEMPDKLKKATSKAVRTVSESIEDDLTKSTPKSGITFERRQQINQSRRAYYVAPMSTQVTKSSLTGAKDGEPEQKVGYRRETSWYRKFVDYGTKHQKAQRFTKDVRDRGKAKADEEFKKAAREGLGL